MIGLIAILVAGFITGARVAFLAPIVYLISLKNRDVGLVAYLLLVLYSGNSFSVSTLYSYSGVVNALVLSLGFLLLLNDLLVGWTRPKGAELISLPFILAGIVIPEAFLAGAVFYLTMILGVGVETPSLLITVVVVFELFKGQLSSPGSVSSQVIVLAAFGVFLPIMGFGWGNFKKKEMFKE